MERKQDLSTGSGLTKTMPGQGAVSTAGDLKHARSVAGNRSTLPELAGLLAILQSDCLDLQKRGADISVLAQGGRIYISVKVAEHVLGFDGHITLDGQKVNEL